MSIVKVRAYDPRLRPRRTRIALPGWAGQPEPRADGSHEQPWHCIPFAEAAKRGMELCYPHGSELHVRKDGAEWRFDATGAPDPADAPPFRSFGEHYYTYRTALDLKLAPGLAVKVETHPRFYTDSTGSVPVAVPAVIQHWWPMIYFVVFKAPAAGQTHVFRPGEPFLQLSLIPTDDPVEIVDMPEAEAAERELQSRRIHESRSTLSADTQWTSSTDTVFDGTYRRMSAAARGLSWPLHQDPEQPPAHADPDDAG